MPAFPLLPGLRGSPAHIRVSPRTLAVSSGGCAAHTAYKARPGLRSTSFYRSRRGAAGEDFALGPVQEGIDLVEFGLHGSGVHRSALLQTNRHTGLARFTVHAVSQYRPHARTRDDPGLRPIRDYWVLQREGGGGNGTLWEAFAWGRRYQSPDGSVREFRFLRSGRAAPERRSTAETALAALVTAYGVLAPVPGPREWSDPFSVEESHHSVSRVRVAEIGLLDGSRAELFEGTPEEARALYGEHAEELLRETVNTAVPNPGVDCSSCKRFSSCEATPRVPGLLGIAPGNDRPRNVSASMLRYFSRCPAQAHLRELKLPKEDEYTPANQRGQAVHSWLEAKHAASDGTACSPEETASDWWRGTGHELDEEQARLGARMIRHHAQVCPLHTPVADMRPEPALAFVDPDPNVVVLVNPDLLYTDEKTLVWRETKTLHTVRRHHVFDPLRRYPQLALALILLAEGALDNDPADSRVELEVLTPGGADLIPFDPGDPDEVGRAREVLHGLADAWYREDSFPTRPGPACGTCPVARWCPDRMEKAP